MVPALISVRADHDPAVPGRASVEPGLPDDISLPSDDELDDPSQPENDLSDLIATIVDLIKDLYRLSFRIGNSNTKFSRATLYKEIDPESGQDLFGECYAPFDRRHVLELFKGLRNGQTSFTADDYALVQRFSDSITTRRRRFRYWQKHGQKLAVSENPVSTVVDVAELPNAPREPALRTIQVQESKKDTAPSQTNPSRTIFTTTEATFYNPKLDLAPLESQSVISVATTARDLEGQAADLPPPPPPPQ